MVHDLKRSQSLPSLWKMANGDGIHSEKYRPEKVGDFSVPLQSTSVTISYEHLGHCFQRMLGSSYQQMPMILSNNSYSWYQKEGCNL